jgi:thioesterase domain-containing protein
MYFTTKHTLAEDVAAALHFIRKRHPNAGPTTLAGHSAGGGLSQYIIGKGKAEGVGKLVILAGFPSYGG